MLEIMRENAGGWVVKILFAIIIIVFVFAFGMSGIDTSGDPVMATVNDEIITRAEFDEAFQRSAEALQRSNPAVTPAQLQNPQFKKMVFNDLVNNRLMLAEAKKLGVSASPEEVFAAITREPAFWNQDGKFDKSVYVMALRGIRMTPAQFEANFKRELIGKKLTKLISSAGAITETEARQIFNWVGEEARIEYIPFSPAQFLNEVTVKDEEVTAFYEKNRDNFMVPEQVSLKYMAFTPQELAKFEKVTDEEIKAYYDANADSMKQEEQVHARHILVMTKESDPESVAKEAKAKIERVLKKARAGQNFAELAKKYSEGPSGPGGGDLGWFGRGMMVPEFEEVAFATEKGKVSEIVKTQFGWHIIFVEDRKEAKTRELADIKDQLKEVIAQEKASDKVSEMLDQAMDLLAADMKIDDVAKELELAAITTQPMVAQNLQQGFGLTKEAVETIVALPEGESHPTPLAVNGGFILLEKIKNTPPAPLPLDDVRELIVSGLKNQKATEIAQQEADAALKMLSGADADKAFAKYKGSLQTSETFDRQGNIAGLGFSKELADAVFAAKDDKWLAKPYPLQAVILVARPKEKIPASDKAWEEQREMWMQQATRNYEQEVLVAYMAGLRAEATIDIARADLLN